MASSGRLRRLGGDHCAGSRARPMLAWAAIACAAATAMACAPRPPESKVARDIKIVREENQPERLFEKGKSFHQIGDLTRAEQYYAAAMQQGYPAEKVLMPLLQVCTEANRFQVAIEYAEPVLNKNPRNHRLRLILASLYRAVGHASRARSYYEIALEDDPNDATGHYMLAVLLRDEFHDLVNADKHFREYLRIDPNGPHAKEANGSLLKEVPTPLPKPPSTPVPASSTNTKPIKLP